MSHHITDEQIRTLRLEARIAGDEAMANVCNRALIGDDDARQECIEAIEWAAEMASDD